MYNLKYGFYLLLSGCSLGLLSMFVKLGYQHGFATSQVISMQLIVVFIMFTFITLFGKKYTFSLKTVIKLLTSGIPMALTIIFYYHALAFLDASIAIIFLFQYIWMEFIIDLIVDKKLPETRQVISVGLLIMGSLGAVNVFSISLTAIPAHGLLWGLLAAISLSVFMFISRHVASHVPVLTKSMLMSVGALIVIILVYPPTYLLTGHYAPSLWLLGFILGLCGVIVPSFLFSLSVPKVGKGLGTILSASELPMTVLISMIVLHEKVHAIQLLGVCIMIIGIIYTHLPHPKTSRFAQKKS